MAQAVEGVAEDIGGSGGAEDFGGVSEGVGDIDEGVGGKEETEER